MAFSQPIVKLAVYYHFRCRFISIKNQPQKNKHTNRSRISTMSNKSYLLARKVEVERRRPPMTYLPTELLPHCWDHYFADLNGWFAFLGSFRNS